MTMLLSSRRALLASLGAASLSACATPMGRRAPRLARPTVPLLDMRADRITRITVCSRPFRAAGPRLEVETVGAKRVVHNYGHGGAGWSLSWGSAALAAPLALEGNTGTIAVLGCGAIGLTTALTLLRAGAKVTIYARERTSEAPSFRATGSWSPDSRIADADKVGPDFAARWEQMTRTSFAKHQTYLGLAGEPVAFHDRYHLRNLVGGARRADPPDAIRFANYSALVRGMAPRSHDMTSEENPFRGVVGRKGVALQFNVSELSHLLTEEFLREGGRIETRTFHTPADVEALPETVIVNCTGYGARALWKDETITPVRGQIAWLPAQPEVRYSIFLNNVSTLSRPDGMVVQQLGESDMWGYGLEDETPDSAEAEAAVATIAALFAAPGV